MSRIFLFIFLSAAGFSCKKEWKKTVIKGTLRDFVTEQPLEGVEVYLQMGEVLDENHTYENVQTVQKFVTGADGKFSTTFKALKDHTYALEYQKPSQCYYGGSGVVTTKERNDIDLKLHSYSTLYIHVKNVSPFDNNDQIYYCLDKSVMSCPFSPVNGMTVDFINEVSLRNLNDKIYIKSFITKNGITNIRLDSVTMDAPYEDKYFDLFY